MSIEWDSLILGGNELSTVGPATENARRANSVRTRGTNSRRAPAESIGLAGVTGAATVNISWSKRRGHRQHLVGQHTDV